MAAPMASLMATAAPMGLTAAVAVVAAALARGPMLPIPQETVETPGEGVTGRVEGQWVAVGGLPGCPTPA